MIEQTEYIPSPYGKVTTNNEPIFWKEFEAKQAKLVQSIVSRFKTRNSIKELIVDELKYAQEKKDTIGLYKREWEFVLNCLKEKVEQKGIRNREEIDYLIRILSRSIKMDMK